MSNTYTVVYDLVAVEFFDRPFPHPPLRKTFGEIEDSLVFRRALAVIEGDTVIVRETSRLGEMIEKQVWVRVAQA